MTHTNHRQAAVTEQLRRIYDFIHRGCQAQQAVEEILSSQRASEAVSGQAHNLEIQGSTPWPATKLYPRATDGPATESEREAVALAQRPLGAVSETAHQTTGARKRLPSRSAGPRKTTDRKEK